VEEEDIEKLEIRSVPSCGAGERLFSMQTSIEPFIAS
jgi:hypothetical protein